MYLLHIIRTVQFLPSLCILPLLARLFVVIYILCFIKLALCCQLINIGDYFLNFSLLLFFSGNGRSRAEVIYLLHIIRTVQFLPSLCILPLLARLFVVIYILCFIKLALCCQLINPLCHLLSVFLWCSSANSASGIRDELLPELWSMWFSIFIESLDCLSRRSNCFNSFAKPDDF